MKKKLLSVAILAVFLLQMIVGIASAQNATSGKLTVEKKTVALGTTEVALQVGIEENQGISNMKLAFHYPEGFVLKELQRGTALPSLYYTAPGKLTNNPVTPIWDGLDADTTNGVILTLVFEITDRVVSGEYAVTVSYEKGNVLDGDLEDIDLEIVQGGVEILCPHTNKTEHAAVAETCTTAGNELYYTCDKCGKLLDQNGAVIETEPVIAAKGHDMTHYDALDPTCTEQGNVEYWLCSRCNKTFADENGETALDTTVIDASGHDYVHHDKVPASHAAAGMEEHYTCNHCELYFDAEKNVTTQAALVIPQIRHSFGDWVKTADDHKRTCACGAVADEGAHTFEWVVDRAATEEATGLKHEECTVCHYAEDGAEIPKLDHTHNMEHHAAAPATCTEDGTVEYWHCTKCGKDYADEQGSTELTSVKEDAHGHDMTRHEAVPATCTEDGTREYWSCRHCNKKFADESGTEEIQNITVKASGHSYGEYVVTTPATCTEKGEETATCAKCQHELTREINALGHSYGEYVVTTPATCTEKGEETATCAKCQHELTREINALGHSLGEYTVTKAPTCTEKGSKTATCSVCRAEITEEIPALDHKWDDGKVTKEATATEKGEKTYTCTGCGETRTEEIPALGENAGVKTGDDTPVVLFTLLGVLSAAGALVLTKKKAGQH